MSDYSMLSYPYLYLGFIVLHFIGGQLLTSSIYWTRFRKNPLIYYKMQENNKHSELSILLSIPVIVWFISLSLYACSPQFRNSFWGWSLNSINPLFGWIFGLIGLLGMLLCQYQMGEAFRVGQEHEQESSQKTLYREACFKYSRNPIYFFSICYLIGVSLWCLIWPVWLSLLITVILIHRLVLSEEQFLSARFGQTYIQYKKEVPRYWPLVKQRDLS